MNGAPASPGRIEPLLVAAHRDLTRLQQRRHALERTGIDKDRLPADLALMAFALLGDYERDGLLGGLRGHWATLQSKGLVYGPIDGAPTAELRLMEHVREHAEAIGSVWDQLRAAQDAPEPPRGVWRSAKRVLGLWGQPVRFYFSIDDVRFVLIEPDPVFGRQPALVAANPEEHYTGEFEFPVDRGTIRIALLHATGTIYRLLVEVMVQEEA